MDQEPRLSISWDKILWVVLPLAGGLFYKVFVLGASIQQTYPTMDAMNSRFEQERLYEKEKHDALEKDAKAYSDHNHDDMVSRWQADKLEQNKIIGTISTTVQVMDQKLSQLIDSNRKK